MEEQGPWKSSIWCQYKRILATNWWPFNPETGMSTFQLTDLQHIRLTFSLLGPVRWPGNGGELLLRLSELKSGNCSQKCLHKVLGGGERRKQNFPYWDVLLWDANSNYTYQSPSAAYLQQQAPTHCIGHLHLAVETVRFQLVNNTLNRDKHAILFKCYMTFKESFQFMNQVIRFHISFTAVLCAYLQARF